MHDVIGWQSILVDGMEIFWYACLHALSSECLCFFSSRDWLDPIAFFNCFEGLFPMSRIPGSFTGPCRIMFFFIQCSFLSLFLLLLLLLFVYHRSLVKQCFARDVNEINPALLSVRFYMKVEAINRHIQSCQSQSQIEEVAFVLPLCRHRQFHSYAP